MSRLSLPDYVLLSLCLVAVVIAILTSNQRTDWFRDWLDRQEEEAGG